jgi:hypothetical protein
MPEVPRSNVERKNLVTVESRWYDARERERRIANDAVIGSAVVHKARVDKINLRGLLQPTEAQTSAALLQISEQIEMPQIEKAERSAVGRKTAAVSQKTRLFFFEIDNDVSQTTAVGAFARRFDFDFDAAKSARRVKILFARENVGRPQDFVGAQINRFKIASGFRSFPRR